ncbi:MAG: hypothetical protein FJX76_13805 [Armatimonadetes bacterium]|nr:hypothetical protein [Armatimonadota bacterium]
MAVAYTPGLKVAEATVLFKERRLPLKGEVLVKAGDRVQHDTVVARTFLPGHVEPVNVANKLSIEPKELKACMLKQEGDLVKKDEEIAISKGFFGLFKSVATSPRDGKIEIISETTGQVMIREADIPVEVHAYIDGVIDHVIPDEGVIVKSYGGFVQGIFGIGGEVTGPLHVLAPDVDYKMTTADIKAEHAGKILVGGSIVTHDVIKAAVKAGVTGIIAGGIDDADLRAWLGYDLGVAITGSEELGVTLVVTEGFGPIRMAAKTYELLKKSNQKKVCISGATQIRAGVIRPEIVVPVPADQWPGDQIEKEGDQVLGMHIGSPVRIIREPNFGLLARVVDLPVELTAVETEAKVRVVGIQLDDGRRMMLPRANVELIEA